MNLDGHLLSPFLAQLAAPADVFAALVEWQHRGRASVLATVVRTSGSTPRKSTARLMLREDGVVVGTIGGGRIEKEVLEAGRAMLTNRSTARPELLRFQLTRDLAMCCGGEMEIFVEPVFPAPPLVVCGSGHVARAVVPLARSVGFLPIVVDEPPDDAEEPIATPEHFPAAARILDSWDPREWDLPLDGGTYVIIVTRDHAVDQKLLEALLKYDLAYLGLIGSDRKVQMFHRRLVAKGQDPERLARVHAPIGIEIGADTPEEIAVSIVAQLIQVRVDHRVDARSG